MSLEARSGKRPREEEGEGSEAVANLPPWERDPARFVHAQEVVRLVRAGESSEGHTPAFLHQYFEDEAIALPESQRPLRIDVLYGPTNLKLHVRCDREMEGAVGDAMFALAAQLPEVEREADGVLLGGPLTEADLSVYGPIVGAYAPNASSKVGAVYQSQVRCESLASSPALKALNDGLQALLRFEVDAHSTIDPTEERWRLFTVWNVRDSSTNAAEEGVSPAPEIVAAASVFFFTRWLQGQAHLVLKVCQVLVLPPHRRQGHASSLLRCIYAYAKEQNAVEITVEDPCPAFRFVRDVVDLRLCQELNLLIPEESGSALHETQRAVARKALRITEEQIARCYEMQAFRMLEEAIRKLPVQGSSSDDKDANARAEELKRAFRLNVKRRLNKKHEEVLKAMSDPQARKAELDVLYQALIAEYTMVLKRFL